MTSVWPRWVGAVARNDLRLVRRDVVLPFLVFGLPLAALVLRWLLPLLEGALEPWVDLVAYRPLVVAGLVVSNQPVFLGVVIGLLLIEERERGTLLALAASPLTVTRLLRYRVAAASLASFVLIPIGVLLIDLVTVPWPVLLTCSALASLHVGVVTLVYATFVRNKVQALVWIRPVQAWAAAGVLLWFVPSPWPWLAAPLVPLYYPMRLFWSSVGSSTEWWLVAPSLVVPVLAMQWLLRRFERAAVAG